MWILILFVVAVILIALGIHGNKNYQQSMDQRILQYYQEHNFNPTKFYFNEEKESGIAYDKEQNKLLLFEQMSYFDNGKVSLIDPSNILETRIIENGDTVTKTARGSQLVGASVGGILAGGLGVIVGGLSGKRYSDKQINELKLELVINDLENPILRVSFLSKNQEKLKYKQNSAIYRKCYENAYYWYKLIEVLIHQQKDYVNE